MNHPSRATLTRTTVTMTVSEWRVRLADLCQSSAHAQHGEESAMLRMGHELLANQPDPRSALADHLPPLARFEALLAAGAHDSAAMALVPETGSYIISRAGGGREDGVGGHGHGGGGEGGCMASVMLPGMSEEMTSEADSPALALVSALAAALATVGAGDVDGEDLGDLGSWASMAAGTRRCGDVACDVEDWQRPKGAILH